MTTSNPFDELGDRKPHPNAREKPQQQRMHLRPKPLTAAEKQRGAERLKQLRKTLEI